MNGKKKYYLFTIDTIVFRFPISKIISWFTSTYCRFQNPYLISIILIIKNRYDFTKSPHSKKKYLSGRR